MAASIIIADDFLGNPHELREAALRLTYPPQDGAFPGRNSLERINVDGLLPQVSRLVGEPLRLLTPPQSHAKCRITLADDVGRARVHVDQSYWSGILYLSRPEDCRGGTDFYRHRRTGLDRVPTTADDIHAAGYPDINRLVDDVVNRDTMKPSAWEKCFTAPMRFNRLILFSPWMFHNSAPGFGTGPDDGRLAYLMFFAAAP